MDTRKTRQDWIDVALSVLARQGIEGVRVERLAETLRVTKGSFYWHFKDRSELLAALLEAWKTRATADVIATVETDADTAEERLRALCRTVFSSDGALDRQVRAWAGGDAAVAAVQVEIDNRRVAYVRALLVEVGLPPRIAAARARFTYHALIGQFAVGAAERQSPRELDLVLDMLLRP